jgi:hypothetical protein
MQGMDFGPKLLAANTFYELIGKLNGLRIPR